MESLRFSATQSSPSEVTRGQVHSLQQSGGGGRSKVQGYAQEDTRE
jgi:hypothetical protein